MSRLPLRSAQTIASIDYFVWRERQVTIEAGGITEQTGILKYGVSNSRGAK